MFAISSDEEQYSGEYATMEEAIAAATENAINGIAGQSETFWIAKRVKPTQPENFWCATDWIDFVSCQDEYSGEWCDDWDQSTKEQRAELEVDVRKLMAAWLDRHGLRPQFFCVSDPMKFVLVDDKPFRATEI